MRILNVNSLVDSVLGGGTAERTTQVSRALAKAGHQVTVLALDIGSGSSSARLPECVRLILLKCLNQRFQVPKTSVVYLRSLVSNYQVIHMMGHWSLLNVLVATAARMEGVPYVVCPAGALPIFGRSRLIKWGFNQLAGKRTVKRASAWIAVTEDERSQFGEYGVPAEFVTVIPNGVTPEDYDDDSGTENLFQHIAGTAPYVLFMGRLNAIKGPDILLEAFAYIASKWPNVHLVLAGPDGGMRAVLSARVQKSGLQDRVHFVGFVGGSSKVAAYRHAKFFVIPSRSDAMSIVVLEAGACKIPVVLTDRCGFDEVELAGGGIVVATNPSSIASAMTQLLEQPEEAAKMGERLYEFVTATYTWDIIVKKYISLYSKVCIIDDAVS